MGIMTRMLRGFKADINGVLDQVEDKRLVLKQLLREMATDLEKTRGKLRRITASGEQARQDHDRHAREIDKLDQDIGVALEKKRDDIAAMLIRRQKNLLYHQDVLRHHINAMDLEISRLQDRIKSRQLDYEKLEIRADGYVKALEQGRWEKTVEGVFPEYPEPLVSDEEIELELMRRKEKVKGEQAS